MYTQVRRKKGREEGLGAPQSHCGFQTPSTFKVHSSISIEVHIADNLLDVSVSHLMTQQLPHGLSQLTGADLPITIGVELESEGGTETAWMGSNLKAEQWPLGQGSFSNQVPSRDPGPRDSEPFKVILRLGLGLPTPACQQPSLTSRKASLSSFTPIISAVSARSLGPISSTKSSKSTWPPTGAKRMAWVILDLPTAF